MLKQLTQNRTLFHLGPDGINSSNGPCNTFDVELKYNPHDLWIGFYWEGSRNIGGSWSFETPRRFISHGRFVLYVCIIPIFVLRFRWLWGKAVETENG